eukprot:2267572-Pleurochrysis_carterae.AAC.1
MQGRKKRGKGVTEKPWSGRREARYAVHVKRGAAHACSTDCMLAMAASRPWSESTPMPKVAFCRQATLSLRERRTMIGSRLVQKSLPVDSSCAEGQEQARRGTEGVRTRARTTRRLRVVVDGRGHEWGNGRKQASPHGGPYDPSCVHGAAACVP